MQIKVKTKNWGEQYRDVSRLIGLKAHATGENEKSLKNEVATHGGHAYGRHGAQTGWEAQFIRAATQITPDQAFDPMGLNPKIRSWGPGGVIKMSDVDGSAVFDIFDSHGNEPTHYEKSAGNTSGGFLTPEAQFLAKSRGEAVVGALNGPVHYAAQYRFKAENRFIRTPLNAVHVVVGARDKGTPYGLGFARRDPKSYPTFTRQFVVDCIDAFLNHKTGNDLFPQVTPSLYKFNVIALRRNKPLFPSMTELADFFELDILWQGACSLIFRRDHNAVAHTHGPWRLITMFPDDLEVGWAPDLFLDAAKKTALQTAGFNKNVNDYHWTGTVTSRDARQKQQYNVPGWA